MLKLHLLTHIVKDLWGLVTHSVFGASLFEHYKVNVEVYFARLQEEEIGV